MKKPEKKTESKIGLGILAFVAFAFIDNIVSLAEGVQLSELGLSAPFLVFTVLGAVLLIVIILLLAAARRKNRQGKKRATAPLFRPRKVEEDCHNRLHPEHAEACPDKATHWKRQLDGFLAAGIIEKDEYRVLLERHSGKLP